MTEYHGAHGVVVSYPLSMQEVLGPISSVSMVTHEGIGLLCLYYALLRTLELRVGTHGRV